MKRFFLILCLIFSLEMWACSCKYIPPIIEFLNSEYVFKAKIENISKENLISFEVLEIYKGTIHQQKIEALTSFMKETSCEWEAQKGEIWLVFARKEGETFSFSSVCSNSKEVSVDYDGMEFKKFNFDDFIFEDYWGFSPIDLSSINLQKLEKFSQKSSAKLVLWIDKNGQLLKANASKNFFPQKFRDEELGLFTKKIQFSNFFPLNHFEKTSIEILKKIKKFPQKIYLKEKKSVDYLIYVEIFYDEEQKKWKIRQNR